MPAAFRRLLGEDPAVVVTLLDQCLAVYSPKQWARLETQLQALPAFSRQVKAVSRLLLSRAAECEIDAQGRILLPAALRDAAKLGRDALVVGVLLGTVAAIRQNSITDYGVMTIAMTGIAIPNFVMAPLLSLVLGVYLGLLPVAGWNGGALPNLVLPVTAMALPYVAYIARLMRGSMIEILRSNYIRTARAKGLRESVVILRHAMPAAILPVVSFLGPATAGILTGSVVIEQIFSLPGIGKFFVQGALNRDYTLVMGVIIFYSSAIILFNIIVDLVYRVLDPRVRQA